MKTLGYYNGSIGELDQMTVPMLDRGCYFGDGVYDVTYSRNYRIYALEEHVDRFFQSAEELKIQPNFTKECLIDLLTRLVKRLDVGNLWVYFQITRGTALRNHAFPKDATPNLWIMLKPAEIRDVYRPMRCITAEDMRFYLCHIKTLNLIPSVLATEASEAAGVDECILHRGDMVTECAHSNISILRGSKLITHPANNLILAGTGRAHLIACAKRHGIAVEETPYTLAELMDADEVLITSASALCMRVLEVDGKAVGGRCPDTVKTLQDDLLRDFLEKTEA